MQVDPGTVASISSPLVGLIGSLGSAAAAVFVVWLFVSPLKAQAERQEKMFERVLMELVAVARDKAEVIHGVEVALQANTEVLKQLGETVRLLMNTIEHRTKS